MKGRLVGKKTVFANLVLERIGDFVDKLTNVRGDSTGLVALDVLLKYIYDVEEVDCKLKRKALDFGAALLELGVDVGCPLHIYQLMQLAAEAIGVRLTKKQVPLFRRVLALELAKVC